MAAESTPLPIDGNRVDRLMNDLRIVAERSLGSVEAFAAKDAPALAKVVVAYRAIVTDTGKRLLHAQVATTRALAAKPGDPALTALLKRTIELLTLWTAHAKGYADYERPATAAEKSGAVSVGWAGVVIALAVAGAVIAVSFTGVAWAVVHFREAQTLSDEVALVERDPSLADALAKLNTTAPNSPTPDPTSPGGSGGGGWMWLLALLGAAGAALYFAPKLGKD